MFETYFFVELPENKYLMPLSCFVIFEFFHIACFVVESFRFVQVNSIMSSYTLGIKQTLITESPTGAFLLSCDSNNQNAQNEFKTDLLKHSDYKVLCISAPSVG